MDFSWKFCLFWKCFCLVILWYLYFFYTENVIRITMTKTAVKIFVFILYRNCSFLASYANDILTVKKTQKTSQCVIKNNQNFSKNSNKVSFKCLSLQGLQGFEIKCVISQSYFQKTHGPVFHEICMERPNPDTKM